MLQPNNGYYEIENSGLTIATGPTESSNSTPFSVKDILNLADQQNGMNYQMEM